MGTIHFEGLTIHYNQSIKVFSDKKSKKIAFISADYEEVHAVLKIEENGAFQVYPRWNINFLVNDKVVTIDLNS